jgi:Lon-like ATP-dependent protease
VLDVALEGEPEKDSLIDRLKSITGSTLDKQKGKSVNKGPSSPSPQ